MIEFSGGWKRQHPIGAVGLFIGKANMIFSKTLKAEQF